MNLGEEVHQGLSSINSARAPPALELVERGMVSIGQSVGDGRTTTPALSVAPVASLTRLVAEEWEGPPLADGYSSLRVEHYLPSPEVCEPPSLVLVSMDISILVASESAASNGEVGVSCTLAAWSKTTAKFSLAPLSRALSADLSAEAIVCSKVVELSAGPSPEV